MEKFSRLLKIMGYLDYVASTAVLAYGIYAQSVFYIGAGLLGYVVALLRPAERLKAALGSKFVRKPGPVGMPAGDVAQEMFLSAVRLDAGSYAPKVRYQSTTYFQSFVGQPTAQRDHVDNVRSALTVLRGSALQLRLGVRAEKIEPRPRA